MLEFEKEKSPPLETGFEFLVTKEELEASKLWDIQAWFVIQPFRLPPNQR